LERRSGTLDQTRDVLRRRRSNQRRHRAALLDPSAAHDYDFISKSRCLSQVVGNQQRRYPELPAKTVERRLQICARDRIQCAERLVEQNHLRPRRNTPRQRNTLTLPARQLVWKTIAKLSRRQANELESLTHARIDIFFAAQSRHQRHVPRHSPVRNQSAMLLRVPDSATQLDLILLTNVPISNEDITFDRLDEPIEATQQRRLARPTLSNQCGCSARWHLQTHVIESDDVTKSM
jgi:hypothetical protein